MNNKPQLYNMLLAAAIFILGLTGFDVTTPATIVACNACLIMAIQNKQ